MPLSARAPLTPDLAQAETLAALSARLDLARAQVMYGSSPEVRRRGMQTIDLIRAEFARRGMVE